MIGSLYLPLMLIALTTRLVQNPTSCGQLRIMREFRLCSKSHNAQYTSTKIKAIPVRTDTAMQEMLANSFLNYSVVNWHDHQSKVLVKSYVLKDLPWYACNRGVAGSLAVTVGLEPTTNGLTDRRSTN